MKNMMRVIMFLGAVTFLSGCQTASFDYSRFERYKPRSILVLPPLNESTDVNGTYGYLSTCTMPLAEHGYYVFPVSVVDAFFKENGMPTAGEMHQAPLNKIDEIFGADAVLYITLNEYGTSYQILASVTKVQAQAVLVDVKSGARLWEGTVAAQQSSGDSGGGFIGMLVTAAVSQIVNHSADQAHLVSTVANGQFCTKGKGLLPGPYLAPEQTTP